MNKTLVGLFLAALLVTPAVLAEIYVKPETVDRWQKPAVKEPVLEVQVSGVRPSVFSKCTQFPCTLRPAQNLMFSDEDVLMTLRKYDSWKDCRKDVARTFADILDTVHTYQEKEQWSDDLDLMKMLCDKAFSQKHAFSKTEEDRWIGLRLAQARARVPFSRKTQAIPVVYYKTSNTLDMG